MRNLANKVIIIGGYLVSVFYPISIAITVIILVFQALFLWRLKYHFDKLKENNNVPSGSPPYLISVVGPTVAGDKFRYAKAFKAHMAKVNAIERAAIAAGYEPPAAEPFDPPKRGFGC